MGRRFASARHHPLNPAFGTLAILSTVSISGLQAQVRASKVITPIHCNGDVITADNVDEVIDYLSSGTNARNIAVAKLILDMDGETPLSQFAEAQVGEIERRLNAVVEYQSKGFHKRASAEIAARIGSSNMCAAGYSCGAATATNAGQCSGCEFKEITPRTTPRTCEYSCKMCCAHFATPASTQCLNSCTQGDPC